MPSTTSWSFFSASFPFSARCFACVVVDTAVALGSGIRAADFLVVRSTNAHPQPSYNIDRFLNTSAHDAPFMAGHGAHQRSQVLVNELDDLLRRLKVADHAGSRR